MAIIPAEEKVFMVSQGTNTTYSGSASLKAMQEWYTMQDVMDSVSPYKIFTAYISVNEDDEMYIVQELKNTIGDITFSKTGNTYVINSPYEISNRLNIVIPGFSNYWGQGNISPLPLDKGLLIYPGFGDSCDEPDCSTSVLAVIEFLNNVNNPPLSSLTWREAFETPEGPSTAYPIEIRVYN